MKNGGQFRGYLVAKSGRWGPLQVGFIADYVTHPEDTQAFSELLNRAFWDFRKDGTDLVSCWVNAKSPFYSQVKGHGFIGFRHAPIICHPKGVGQRVLDEPYKWHFTMADSDNI